MHDRDPEAQTSQPRSGSNSSDFPLIDAGMVRGSGEVIYQDNRQHTGAYSSQDRRTRQIGQCLPFLRKPSAR